MRNPFRRPRYSVVDPAQDRNGGLVIGQASDKDQAYELAKAFGRIVRRGLWVVKVR